MKNLILSKNHPDSINKLYPTPEQFLRHLYALSFMELKETLKRFEDSEYYEQCIVIDNVIQIKLRYIVTP